MMNLLYITFGQNTLVHSQAYFSIYSFLRSAHKVNSINIITDSASWYSRLGNRVNVLEVHDMQLKDWKGPHDFFWRIKIKAIQLLAKRCPGEPVIYLDTDTFLYGDINGLALPLTSGQAMMHEDEGPLSLAKSKTEKRMWQQVKNRIFGGVTIHKDHSMWNAGVVASPNTKNEAEWELALQICDEMCEAGVSRRLIEQFSLGVALAHVYGVAPAKDQIAHYWSSKDEWDKMITSFFTEAYAKNWEEDEMVSEIEKIDLGLLPVRRKMKNTGVRLHKLIDNLFKPKEVAYIKQR